MAARISKDDFQAKVLDSDIPVIVDFYSDSCVACKKLSPVLGDIEDEYEGKLNVYKVNSNYDEDLVLDYRIMSNPTLKFFKDGKVVASKVGAATLGELKEWVESNLND